MSQQTTETTQQDLMQESIVATTENAVRATDALQTKLSDANGTVNTIIQRVSTGNQSLLQRKKDAMYLQRTIGNRAVTQLMKGLQKRDAGSEDTGAIRQTAAAGVSGAGSQLPHYDKIQNSFGKHDVSNVQAYTNTLAQAASRSIGAEAYTTG
ncbi:MAG: hypothetical protein JKY13_00710, partial [Gammaproteobacteria bacterium]|nr:hypothetical protein [Gammaproteobacteria bacterium]